MTFLNNDARGFNIKTQSWRFNITTCQEISFLFLELAIIHYDTLQGFNSHFGRFFPLIIIKYRNSLKPLHLNSRGDKYIVAC